jgi:hypothetical protein
LRDLDRVAATRRAFFLAVPALVASGAYEAIKEASVISTGVGWLPTVLATGVSFVVGYASIAWLLRFVAKHRITVFIWYRVALAAVIAVLLGTGMLMRFSTLRRISDRPYGVDSLAGWVFEYPILIAFAGIERAGVAAAHGDHDVKGFDDLVVLRPSAMCSATRQALAMIVSVGLMPVPVGNGPPSTTKRFSTSWLRHQRSSTEVSGSLPIRVVPCWWEQLPVMRSM